MGLKILRYFSTIFFLVFTSSTLTGIPQGVLCVEQNGPCHKELLPWAGWLCG